MFHSATSRISISVQVLCGLVLFAAAGCGTSEPPTTPESASQSPSAPAIAEPSASVSPEPSEPSEPAEPSDTGLPVPEVTGVFCVDYGSYLQVSFFGTEKDDYLLADSIQGKSAGLAILDATTIPDAIAGDIAIVSRAQHEQLKIIREQSAMYTTFDELSVSEYNRMAAPVIPNEYNEALARVNAYIQGNCSVPGEGTEPTE